MSLELYFPRGLLAEYVHMFWFWEDYTPLHLQERILPHGSMELTINLSDGAFKMHYPEDNVRSTAIYGPMLAGVRSKFYVIDTVQPTTLLSVYFKAGAGSAIFGLPAHELANLHISLETLWQQDALDLYEQLLETPNTQHRFHILEQSLLQCLHQNKAQHRAVRYALQVFQNAHLTKSMAEIAHDVGISQTRFIQVFRETVGMTPKKFERIQRFQEALRLITQSDTPDWIDVALQCGYFDQSHLINEFQTFAGFTPTIYLPQDAEHFNNLPYFD